MIRLLLLPAEYNLVRLPANLMLKDSYEAWRIGYKRRDDQGT